jgi:hypothetical protein
VLLVIGLGEAALVVVLLCPSVWGSHSHRRHARSGAPQGRTRRRPCLPRQQAKHSAGRPTHVHDNVALGQLCGIAGADEVGIAVVGERLDEADGERFVGVERAAVRAN